MDNEKNLGNAVNSRAFGKREKLMAALFSIFLIALVLSPIIENWRAKPVDSFPLSYYPMFTTKRGATETVTHLVGLDESGNRHLIPHRFAGTGGMNQVRKQISKSARSTDAPQFCQTIAEKVARHKSERYRKIVRVLIVSGEYNLDDYFEGMKNPVEEKLRVECPVQRTETATANEQEAKDE